MTTLLRPFVCAPLAALLLGMPATGTASASEDAALCHAGETTSSSTERTDGAHPNRVVDTNGTQPAYQVRFR